MAEGLDGCTDYGPLDESGGGGGPHTRECPLARAPGARHIPEPIAGSPLKRQRRKELRCIQPRIPMHQRRMFSDTEKIVAIFGMSLDEVLELMSSPFAEADLHGWGGLGRRG